MRLPRRVVWLGVAAVVVLAAVVALIWWLQDEQAEGDAGSGPRRTVIVQNKVAIGPSTLAEDDTPAYLSVGRSPAARTGVARSRAPMSRPERR